MKSAIQLIRCAVHELMIHVKLHNDGHVSSLHGRDGNSVSLFIIDGRDDIYRVTFLRLGWVWVKEFAWVQRIPSISNVVLHLKFKRGLVVTKRTTPVREPFVSATYDHRC